VEAHGKDCRTAKRHSARQRESHGKESTAHGKAASLGKAFAVRFSRDARQRRLCRVDLCRAIFAVHGRTAKTLPS
jgi:hypothetical protein